jgi:hypothetical protein
VRGVIEREAIKSVEVVLGRTLEGLELMIMVIKKLTSPPLLDCCRLTGISNPNMSKCFRPWRIVPCSCFSNFWLFDGSPPAPGITEETLDNSEEFLPIMAVEVDGGVKEDRLLATTDHKATYKSVMCCGSFALFWV